MGLPSVDVPDGYELVDISNDGFVVAVPSEWVVLELTDEAFDEILEAGTAALDPEAAELMEAAVVGLPGFSLFAMGLLGDPTMNVLVFPISPFDTIGNIEEIGKETFGQLGANLLEIEHIEIAGNEAIRFLYEFTTEGVLVEGHQYVVLTEDLSFTVSFASADPEADRSAIELVMSTFTPTGN